MKHITILVPEGEGNNLSSIVGAYKILTRANAFRKQNGGSALFSIQLAGNKKKIAFHEGVFTVQPHVGIRSIQKTDLVIIPSVNHQYEEAIKRNRPMINWIEKQYHSGAAIASICTGAFLLAASGLLNGKRCSTHWAAENNFRRMFPEVDLQPDQLITDEKGIYTNGGAFSFLNLMIYLVEKYFDRATAIYCAKVFQIEMDRNNQSAFAIFTGQKQHGDELVQRAQTFIERHVQEKISMEELSLKLAIGRRNFDRRFIKATGNTPVEYAQRVKVEAAKKALESSRKTISEIMYEVGYLDVKAFREVFRGITGMSPLEYRSRYNNAMAR
ncbi:MAG: GlxA family transcriptional regulator [Chitinophagaceae bacterium]